MAAPRVVMSAHAHCGGNKDISKLHDIKIKMLTQEFDECTASKRGSLPWQKAANGSCLNVRYVGKP